MAKDMASRYLRQMEVFNRRGLHNLGDLLSTEPETIAPGKREKLAKQVDTLRRRYAVSAERRRGLYMITFRIVAATFFLWRVPGLIHDPHRSRRECRKRGPGEGAACPRDPAETGERIGSTGRWKHRSIIGGVRQPKPGSGTPVV